MKFLHSSDWHLGRSFSTIPDESCVTRLRDERIKAVDALGAAAREKDCAFVLVAGDLFDSNTVDKPTVAAACAAIARIKLPVYVIPGNHDNAGPGSVWTQPFFTRIVGETAPNLHVLLERKPEIRPEAVILPCPLFRRQDSGDVLDWLQDSALAASLPADRPWIVLAHGSIQGFDFTDPEDADGVANLLDLDRLAGLKADYIALGDWHGAKSVRPNAWYSGTPELTTFPKGGDHDPGNALLVDLAARGAAPQVTKISTAQIRWETMSATVSDAASVAALKQKALAWLGDRSGRDVLRLSVTGQLGLDDLAAYRTALADLGPRLLFSRFDDGVTVKPTAEELARLTGRADPLISQLAGKLVADQSAPDAQAAARATAALELLHSLVVTAVASK